MKTDKKFVIAVDLGGTNIKFGLIDTGGGIHYRARRETAADRGKEEVIARIFSGIEECQKACDDSILGIGIGSPGPLDVHTGVIIQTPNMPGWENTPLRGIIEQKFGLPAFLENDANAAARGESWIGAGKEVDDMLQLTLGTGIGGGVILNNRIWHGFQSGAGELGHTIIDYNGRVCGCGNRGCIEAYAAAGGIVARFEERIAAGAESLLVGKCRSPKIEITPKLISEAASEGDRTAIEIIEETGRMLGAAITSMVNAFNPQMVVLSGGIARTGELLFRHIREEVGKRAMYPLAEELLIVPSKFEDDTGIIGAARCLLDFLEENK